MLAFGIEHLILVCWCLFDLRIVSSDVLVVCWGGSGVVLLGNERGGAWPQDVSEL